MLFSKSASDDSRKWLIYTCFCCFHSFIRRKREYVEQLIMRLGAQFKIKIQNTKFFGGFTEDNICISNRQESEPGAQQNLWCKILEF